MADFSFFENLAKASKNIDINFVTTSLTADDLIRLNQVIMDIPSLPSIYRFPKMSPEISPINLWESILNSTIILNLPRRLRGRIQKLKSIKQWTAVFISWEVPLILISVGSETNISLFSPDFSVLRERNG
ncbi:hypothetical protein PFISCL1PPCAC_18936 [Pristionchus fissidentatus]|uniref:Uncharacterized protein n=1 Tax=Pristionchus fissidentatus TaxID=1538716 RepID=A0AAV5WCU4_9BILA|nr:hypothetical protein PFISCL1PPCAC_18936 [Pristionchus fissidentatus]